MALFLSTCLARGLAHSSRLILQAAKPLIPLEGPGKWGALGEEILFGKSMICCSLRMERYLRSGLSFSARLFSV